MDRRQAGAPVSAVVTDRRRPCLAGDQRAVQFLLCLRHPQWIAPDRRTVGPAGGNAVASRRRRNGGGAFPDEFDQLAIRPRSEEHTSELQSLMRISYAVFCLKKKTIPHTTTSLTCTIVNTSSTLHTII